MVRVFGRERVERPEPHPNFYPEPHKNDTALQHCSTCQLEIDLFITVQAADVCVGAVVEVLDLLDMATILWRRLVTFPVG
jgi:hypothetical protein